MSASPETQRQPPRPLVTSGGRATVTTSPRRRVRVLLVGRGEPDRGGIAAFLHTLMESALVEDHDLTFLNLSRTVAPVGGRLSAANLRRTAVDASRVWTVAADHDVVHIHSALTPAVTLARASLLAMAAKARRRPVILHAHGGLVPAWLGSTIRRLAARVLLSPVDVVVPVATTMSAALEAVSPGRTQLIPNGVDADRFATRARSDRPVPTVLYAGLLTRRKGVLDLVDASTRLVAQGLDHRLVLVGGTPDEGTAEERLVRAALAGLEHVEVVGPRPASEMPRYYAGADVFCLPSWWEAMPLTVLEAMASGLPVVATSVGDVPAMVVAGETGAIVPPRDPTALAAALGELLGDPARRASVGEAGATRAGERFALSSTLGELDLLYRQVAG
jgi:glycosyltransferase involved in cell wall biosynthesis